MRGTQEEDSVQGMLGDAKREFAVADMMPDSRFLTVADSDG
jgi:hypothetical protein